MQMANIFMCDVDRAHVMMMMCTVAVLYVSMSEFLLPGRRTSPTTAVYHVLASRLTRTVPVLLDY